MTLFDTGDGPSELEKLLRLLDRYRDLLAGAKDELLRRGIQSQIDSLENKLRARETEEPPRAARGFGNASTDAASD